MRSSKESHTANLKNPREIFISAILHQVTREILLRFKVKSSMIGSLSFYYKIMDCMTNFLKLQLAHFHFMKRVLNLQCNLKEFVNSRSMYFPWNENSLKRISLYHYSHKNNWYFKLLLKNVACKAAVFLKVCIENV